MNTNAKTVIMHLLMASLLAVLTLVQQGETDYKVLLVALAVAATGFMEKNDGPWKTTVGGALLAAASVALPMLQGGKPEWLQILAAMAIAFITFYMGDRNHVPATKSTYIK